MLRGCSYSLALALPVTPAFGASLALFPSADAVLYEDAAGSVANGSGEFLLAGRTNQASGSRRRSLLQFDLTGLPVGAVVTGAYVRLHLVTVATSEVPVSLHRLTSAWSEGPADPAGNESAGFPAIAGDVTWLHASVGQSLWSVPGGDAVPAASASVLVGTVSEYYSWSGPAIVDDVEAWMANPAANFGWMLRTDESVPQTAKRFESGDSLAADFRPVLFIDYEVIPEPSSVWLLLGAWLITGSRHLAGRSRLKN